jgi:hypothetical protein
MESFLTSSKSERAKGSDNTLQVQGNLFFSYEDLKYFKTAIQEQDNALLSHTLCGRSTDCI